MAGAYGDRGSSAGVDLWVASPAAAHPGGVVAMFVLMTGLAPPPVTAAANGPDSMVGVATKPRLVSVDVLRGLSIAVMVLVDVPGNYLVHPAMFVHVPWAGLSVADLVFPGFVVASGGALALTSRSASTKATFIRFSRIFVVGLLLVSWKYLSLGFRSGTLQFIAGAWLVGALLHRLPVRWRVPAAVGLMGTVALLHYIPALPGAVGWGQDGFDAQVDTLLFGSRSDLGVLGMVSAGCVGLFASAVVGAVRTATPRRRVEVFAASAVVAGIVAGGLIAVGVPVVKRAWTPSYLFVGFTVCLVVLALAEALAASPARKMLEPFVALGLNALPLYVVMTAVAVLWTDGSRKSTTAWLQRLGLGPGLASISVSLLVLAVMVALAWWLRRNGRVIRL